MAALGERVAMLARQPSRADAASPIAARSLARRRPSASCFAATRRSTATTSGSRSRAHGLAEEQPAVLGRDREVEAERRDQSCRVRRRRDDDGIRARAPPVSEHESTRRGSPPAPAPSRRRSPRRAAAPPPRTPRPRPAAGRRTRRPRTRRLRRSARRRAPARVPPPPMAARPATARPVVLDAHVRLEPRQVAASSATKR